MVFQFCIATFCYPASDCGLPFVPEQLCFCSSFLSITCTVHGWCCVRYDYPNLCEFKKKKRHPDPLIVCLYPWERSCEVLSGFLLEYFVDGTMNFCYCLDFFFANVSVSSSKLLLSSSIPNRQIKVPSGFSNISVDTFLQKYFLDQTIS